MTYPSYLKKSPQNIVLVVDDNPTNLEVLYEALSDHGLEVWIATDGESAIEQASYDPPDLILLDILMPPGIDGFETCRRLKQAPKTQDIPILFMTALSDAEDKVQGFAAGAVDYITKPFEQGEVLARVDVHLQIRNLSAALETQNQELKFFNQRLKECVQDQTKELQDALDELERSQLLLIQQEKMSSLGQMSAGIAHEINNPLGFVSGNLKYAQRYMEDLLELVSLYEQSTETTPSAITAYVEDIGLEFIKTDFPMVLGSMAEGANRIRDISHSMRIFSRADYDKKVLFNIHDGLESTLLILKHRLLGARDRPPIEVIKNYNDTPEIYCFPGQLNQVFMNLLGNAIDMFDELSQKRSIDELMIAPNRITIDTSYQPDSQQLSEQSSEQSSDSSNGEITITIADNGLGISENALQKIFDPAFTTKDVGKGTGLGLAIAQQIVEEKHHGTLACRSTCGVGTWFTIKLPVVDYDPSADASP